MLKETLSSLHLSRLAAAFLLTVMVADWLPHPNLGPSLFSQVFSNVIQPVIAAESVSD